MSKLTQAGGQNSPCSSNLMGSVHVAACAVLTQGLSAWLQAYITSSYANALRKMNSLPSAHFPCELEAYEMSWKSSVKVTEKAALRQCTLTHGKREVPQ